jgi:hypothetical protein
MWHLNRSTYPWRQFFGLKALALCALLGLAMVPAHAKRLALVMGNDNYQKVSKLQKAGNDADAMAQELRVAGFEVSLFRDLDYRGMVKATEALYDQIQGGDEVVVFFAGHGVQIKSGNFLLPTDIEATTESAVERTSYSLNDLTERLEAAKAAFSLVMIDACRDNPLKSKGRSVGNARGMSPPDPPKGQMVVYSASRGEQALDRLSDDDMNPNSVFTREFVAHMRKPGVRVEDLVREIQVSVEKLAASVGHKQRPALYNEVHGNFYFLGPSPVVTPLPVQGPVVASGLDQAQREDRFWEDTKSAGNREGFEAYLELYPRGRYASLARANINRLTGNATAPARTVPAYASEPIAINPPPRPTPVTVVAEKAPIPARTPSTSSPQAVSAPNEAMVLAQPQAAVTRTNNRITLPNGDRYEGDLVGVTRSGVGRYMFANGDRYEGDFVDNAFQGKGTQTLANGDVYTGDFVKGAKTGRGIYQFANGDRYDGNFIDNIFSGKGVIVFASGDHYEGDIVNGVKNGQGIHYFASKDRYEGGFLNGAQSGPGTHYYFSGDKYEGGFANGVRHGKGLYRFADGQLAEQEFLNGVEMK